MKNTFLFLVLALYQLTFSQDYSLVNKAEKKINEKDYKKALRLLNRAENADYGFCGTAKIEAIDKVYELKLRLFKETKNLVGLKDFLDNIEFEWSDEKYSIERISLALNYYSHEEFKKLLIEEIGKSNGEDYREDFIYLEIQKKYKIKLWLGYFKVESFIDKEGINYNEALLKVFQKSVYWNLLN
jgi:hypothetical protein